jgi:hypothetical protein
MFIVDICGNLDSGASISVYCQWIAKRKQLIGMIGEACYKYTSKIRLYSAERAGAGGGAAKTFRHLYLSNERKDLKCDYEIRKKKNAKEKEKAKTKPENRQKNELEKGTGKRKFEK